MNIEDKRQNWRFGHFELRVSPKSFVRPFQKKDISIRIIKNLCKILLVCCSYELTATNRWVLNSSFHVEQTCKEPIEF